MVYQTSFLHSHNYFTLSAYCLTKCTSTTFYYTTPLITLTRSDITAIAACMLQKTFSMLPALHCIFCLLILLSELSHMITFLLLRFVSTLLSELIISLYCSIMLSLAHIASIYLLMILFSHINLFSVFIIKLIDRLVYVNLAYLHWSLSTNIEPL